MEVKRKQVSDAVRRYKFARKTVCGPYGGYARILLNLNDGRVWEEDYTSRNSWGAYQDSDEIIELVHSDREGAIHGSVTVDRIFNLARTVLNSHTRW